MMDLKRNEKILPFLGEKKGWNIGVEFLLFVVVFALCTIAQIIVIMPVELVKLFGDPAYTAAAESGDSQALIEATTEVLSGSWYLLTALFSDIVMIAIVFGFCALLQKRSPRKLGFAKCNWLKEYGLGLAAGAVMFSAAVLISFLTGALTISVEGGGWILIVFALAYMVQGMAEEVLCRGYLMCSVARRYPLWMGILVNSLVFASLHLLNNGITVLAFVNLTLFGIFASLYFVRRGSIWGIGALHSVWNFMQGNIYGIPVSGTGKTASLLVSTLTGGKELINGGAFGSEGGLAVTVVLVIGIIFLYKGAQAKVPAAEDGFRLVNENA